MEVSVGDLIDGAARRDAIHIAVAPVTAEEELFPGNPCGVRTDDPAIADGDATPVGIVDPFLQTPVRPGQKFWLFLYPNTVTGMRHQWLHETFDKFPEPEAAAEPPGPPRLLDRRREKLSQFDTSQDWLENFASEVGWSYEEVLDIAAEALKGGDPFVGDDNMQDTFMDNKMDLLFHASIMLGKGRPDKETIRASYFRCAC